jgi:hypothetical protein
MEEIIVAGMAAEAVRADDAGVAASEVRRLEERVRELERLLGRKPTEVEILKEALDLARALNPQCCRARRYSHCRIKQLQPHFCRASIRRAGQRSAYARFRAQSAIIRSGYIAGRRPSGAEVEGGGLEGDDHDHRGYAVTASEPPFPGTRDASSARSVRCSREVTIRGPASDGSRIWFFGPSGSTDRQAAPRERWLRICCPASNCPRLTRPRRDHHETYPGRNCR